jgi:plastocyanin
MSRTRIITVTLIVMALSRGAWALQNHTVAQKGKAFSVSIVKVGAGDTVVFKNDDQVTHNVFSASKGHEFNLKAQAPGASSSVKVSGDGNIEVRCAFHPRMKLTVTVVKP